MSLFGKTNREVLKNAAEHPKIYFGLHMVEGVAEYKDASHNDGEPYRILIGEKCIKEMDRTCAGKPLYVQHVDEVNLENIQAEADGYVIESFFNKSDGKHWCKFIAVNDSAHEAIRMGWKLSNAYIPEHFGPGGLWHGVEYIQEVTSAVYEHMAIVPNPRYTESVILTPEQFAQYNIEKENHLKKFANSNEETPPMFLKKEKVANSTELEGMSIVLPKSKKEISVKALISNADEAECKKDEPKMANGDDNVKVGDQTMKINDLVAKYSEMAQAKKNAEDEEEEKKKNANLELPEGEGADELHNEGDDDEIENADDKEDGKKENEEDDKKKPVENKKKNASHFNALKNAPSSVIRETPVYESAREQVARGTSRYGSK